MEILQNTILKLITRQGTNVERQQIVPASGELAFANDISRLFVGTIDGLSGGTVVGNKFLGIAPNVETTFTSPISGDMAYDTDRKGLYVYKGGLSTSILNWQALPSLTYVGSDYINVNNTTTTGNLSLNALSAGILHSSIVKAPIILDGSTNQITLSAKIPFSTVSTNTVTISSGLNVKVNGLSADNTAVNLLSSNVVLKTNQIFARYNGSLSAIDASCSRDVLSVIYNSPGNYKFIYNTIPDIYHPIAIASLHDESVAGDCHARTRAISNSSCDVMILKYDGTNNPASDGIVSLLITY
jgi:hypothetical protein